MSLYGHSDISKESLQRWVRTLSVEGLHSIEIGGHDIIVSDEIKNILNLEVSIFTKLVDNLKQDDDWRTCLSSLYYLYSPSSLCLDRDRPLFYSAFIRVDNSSIRIGDFYECLITPSNIETYKKIIRGFNYNEIGEIRIEDMSGNCIADIGKKSDLIWQTFYEYFINENEDGSIDHTYQNHEQYLSIQLYDVEDLSGEELKNRVNEILLRVSMEYQMDFRVFSVDPLFKFGGEASLRVMQFTPTGFEQVPMLYLTAANNSSDSRLAYLCYYQVIEYFFIRAQNNCFLSNFSTIDLKNVNHNDLRKVLNSYKKATKEKESLNLVLSHALNITDFKKWINEKPERNSIYCNSEEYKIDIAKNDDKIVSQLVQRVYAYRCSIAHAKGDVEEFIAVPSLSEVKIGNELPLLKYLAFKTINYYSQA